MRRFLVGTIAKKQFKIPIELLEQSLTRIGFYASRKTATSKHYRRRDGLHVILTMRRKGKMKEVPWTDENAKIAIVKIHKDSVEHKVLEFDAGSFFKELDAAIKTCTYK